MISEESKKPINRTKPFVFAFILVLFLVSQTQTTHAVPNGGYAHPGMITQPEELKVLIEKRDPSIRVIDVREKLQYLNGHIPGAVQVWRPDIEDKMHVLPGMMAVQKQVEDLMGALGISSKSMIVIYSDGPDNGRLWWVLAYYGFPIEQMKLLDGGIDGWKAKGYPTEVVPPKTEKTIFVFPKETEGVRTMLCTLSDVKSALRKSDKVVLDVRSQEEFLGTETKKGAARPGRVPGVIWIEWKEVLVEAGSYKHYWKPAEEIKRLFSTKGITPDKDVYIY
ncbi:MAG TPA: rhodanese-like domain-containing protein [Thermodesulfobacteriota bacterium]|nr:rhodanese-like domain-containing protein [Thermodesulfobacteriota bacterium]